MELNNVMMYLNKDGNVVEQRDPGSMPDFDFSNVMDGRSFYQSHGPLYGNNSHPDWFGGRKENQTTNLSLDSPYESAYAAKSYLLSKTQNPDIMNIPSVEHLMPNQTSCHGNTSQFQKELQSTNCEKTLNLTPGHKVNVNSKENASALKNISPEKNDKANGVNTCSVTGEEGVSNTSQEDTTTSIPQHAHNEFSFRPQENEETQKTSVTGIKKESEDEKPVNTGNQGAETTSSTQLVGVGAVPPKRKRGRPPQTYEKKSRDEIGFSDNILPIYDASGNRMFICDICGKVLTQANALEVHKRLHTGEKPFSCGECGKCFTQQSGLTAHRRLHTGERPYKCGECEKCFTQPAGLIAHKRLHTGEKPYVCDDCGKCFTQQSGLTVHKRIHTGEKPFCCQECQMRFSQPSSLYSHMKRHSGEKPFTCEICNKSFTQLTGLNSHRNTHTGEKPFECELCHKCFSQASSLNGHRKLHTGEKVFECDICFLSFTGLKLFKKHTKSHHDEK